MFANITGLAWLNIVSQINKKCTLTDTVQCLGFTKDLTVCFLEL